MDFNDMQSIKAIYDSLNNLKLELKTTNNVSQFICCFKRFFIAVYLTFYKNEESLNRETSCFDGLEHYLTNFLSSEELSSYISTIFPCIIDTALKFLKYPSHSIHTKKDTKEVLINNNLLASVLACHILCLVPSQKIISNKKNTSKTVENCLESKDLEQNILSHNHELENNNYTSDDLDSTTQNIQENSVNSPLIQNEIYKKNDPRPRLIQSHYNTKHLHASKSNKNPRFHSVFLNFYSKIGKSQDARDCEKLKYIFNFFYQLQTAAEAHKEDAVIIIKNNKASKEPSKPSSPPSSSLCPIIITENPLSSRFASYCLLPSIYAQTEHLDIMLLCVSYILNWFGVADKDIFIDGRDSLQVNTNKNDDGDINSLHSEKNSNVNVFGDSDGCVGAEITKSKRVSDDSKCCGKRSERVDEFQWHCGSSFIFTKDFGGLNKEKDCGIYKEGTVKNGVGCISKNNSSFKKRGVKSENKNNCKSKICVSCTFSCEKSSKSYQSCASNISCDVMVKSSGLNRIDQPASLLMVPRRCIHDLNLYIEDINLSVIFYLQHLKQQSSCKNLLSTEKSMSNVCDDDDVYERNNNNIIGNNNSTINMDEKVTNEESSKRKEFNRETCFNTQCIGNNYNKENRSSISHAKTIEDDQLKLKNVINKKKDNNFNDKRGLEKVVEYCGTKDELLSRHKNYCENFYIQVFRDSMSQLFPTNDNYDICDFLPAYKIITNDYILDSKLDGCDDENYYDNRENINRYEKDKEKVSSIDCGSNCNEKDPSNDDFIKNKTDNKEGMKGIKEESEDDFEKEYNKERGMFDKMMQSKVEETEKFSNARRHFEEFLGRRSKRSNTFHSLEDVHEDGKGVMRVNTNRSKSNDAHSFKHKHFLNRDYSESCGGCYDSTEDCYSFGDTNTDLILRHLCYEQSSNTSASGDGLNFASAFSEVDIAHSLPKDRDILKRKKEINDVEGVSFSIDSDEKNVHFVDVVAKNKDSGKSLDEIATNIASWFLSKKASGMPLRTDYRDAYVNYHNYATNFVFSVFTDVINELNTAETKVANNSRLELLAHKMANDLMHESKVVILDRLVSKKIGKISNKKSELALNVNFTKKYEDEVKNQKNYNQMSKNNERTKRQDISIKHIDWLLLELLLHWVTASQHTLPSLAFVCCLPANHETYLDEIQKLVTFFENKGTKVKELRALLTQWFNQQHRTDLFSFLLSSL